LFVRPLVRGSALRWVESDPLAWLAHLDLADLAAPAVSA
jgi:hypothetical protein